MPAEDKAESDTKATIAEGEIEIRDKDKQKQDLKDLNRDTRNSLNKLGEIFDKESIKERQELAGLFGELAYNQIHDMKGTDEQKAAYHALVGGIMSQLTSGDFLAGASAAAVNKLVMGEIKKIAGKDPAMMQWLSAAVGAVVSDIIGNNYQSGASIASNATKNNEYGKAPKYEGAFKKVGDTWYQYVDGEYVKTDNRPGEGVPYWVANLEDVDGMGYDYIKGNGDYASDKYVPEKIDFSWYVTIDGEAYGFTIFDQTDAQKKVVIQKGLEQYAYAVAMGSASNNAGEIRDLVKFVEEYNKYQDTNKVQEYINDFLKGRAIDLVIDGKSAKNG